MTDSQFTAMLTFGGVVVAAIPTWIVAYGALKQAQRAAVLAEKAELANAEIITKTDQISLKADEIHTLTNSTLTTSQEALALANEHIRTLQLAINKLVENGKALSAGGVLVVPVVATPDTKEP